MSLLTDFLKLFKYDPETDRDKTFNITQALNENWDKIDADKKAQDDAIATKETPAGAQAKADAAETSAKSYADNIGTALSGIIGSLGSLLTTVKTNIVAAINSLKSELDAHKADNTPHREAVSIERKNPDDDGVFTLIEFRRSDGTLFKTSQLNGTSPYTSRTVKYYDKNENLMQTVEYSITYSNDEVISEVIISAE